MAGTEQGVVLWLAHGCEGGGVARSLLSVREALAPVGLEVRLLTLSAGSLTDLAQRHHVPTSVASSSSRLALKVWERCPNSVLTPASFAFAGLAGLGRAVEDELQRTGWNPVIAVHVRSPVMFPVAAAITRTAEVPLIWQIANAPREDSRLRQALYVWSVRRWQVRPVANSQYVRALYGFLGQLPWAYVPIESTYLTADVAPLPSLPVRFLSMGRVSGSKGQDVLVAAFEQYKRRGGTGRLRVVGLRKGDVASSELRKQVHASPWRDTIELVEYVSDPIGCFEDSHVVLAGNVVRESFGQTTAQGLLLGRPVLAIGGGGPGELVAATGFGWHASRFDRDTISEGLETADREYMAMVARAGSAQAAVRELLDPLDFVHTYQEVLSRPARRP
jgi:glycosyltransferase involved in cell wall biosynthesis